MNTLCLCHVSKNFTPLSSDPVQIFQDINVQFEQGTSYAIMGPSGIGKSTLLHLLADIDDPTSGTIELNQMPIANHPDKQKISIMFQQPSLLNELTVIENVMLKAIINNNVNQATRTAAYQLLQEAGLTDKANCAPYTLSGGQQQRVAILRALFDSPCFVLADEPTGNLDKETGQQILQLLQFYQKKYQIGLIITTHDYTIAQQCNHIFTIQQHQLKLQDRENIFTNSGSNYSAL